MLWCILVVILSGAVGGLVNAFLSDNGFIKPQIESCGQVEILRPGVLGNCLVSAVAAFISWGLYGSAATINLLGSPSDGAQRLQLTLATVCGALLVGVAGARWLTNEVDKHLLRAAATQAAASPKDVELAQSLAIATPAIAMHAARQANEMARARGVVDSMHTTPTNFDR